MYRDISSKKIDSTYCFVSFVLMMSTNTWFDQVDCNYYSTMRASDSKHKRLAPVVSSRFRLQVLVLKPCSKKHSLRSKWKKIKIFGVRTSFFEHLDSQAHVPTQRTNMRTHAIYIEYGTEPEVPENTAKTPLKTENTAKLNPSHLWLLLSCAWYYCTYNAYKLPHHYTLWTLLAW